MRRKVTGKKTGAKAVKNRQILLERDKDHFLNLLVSSYMNIMFSIEDHALLDLLMKKQEEYENLKQTPEWRKGIA